MRDIEIKEVFKIPNSTLYKWKKIDKNDDWRKRIIDFLEALTKEEAEIVLERKNKKITKIN